jgi:hypothetical protein
MISQEFALMVLRAIPKEAPGKATSEVQAALGMHPPYALRQVRKAISELREWGLVVSNASEDPKHRKYWRAPV